MRIEPNASRQFTQFANDIRFRLSRNSQWASPWLLTGAFLLSCFPTATRAQQPSNETVPQKAADDKAKDDGFADLLTTADELKKDWKYFPNGNAANSQSTWKLAKVEGEKHPVLICSGEPYGYLRSLKTYRNYELTLEWKYPADPNGNSGVLVHTSGDDKIWPTAVQVQLHNPKAGSVFPSGEAQTDNRLDITDYSKPVNQWNRCVITSQDGKIQVVINQKKAGEVTGCMPDAGSITLQSEGAEVHFRRIRLKSLDKPNESEEKAH